MDKVFEVAVLITKVAGLGGQIFPVEDAFCPLLAAALHAYAKGILSMRPVGVHRYACTSYVLLVLNGRRENMSSESGSSSGQSRLPPQS